MPYFDNLRDAGMSGFRLDDDGAKELLLLLKLQQTYSAHTGLNATHCQSTGKALDDERDIRSGARQEDVGLFVLQHGLLR